MATAFAMASAAEEPASKKEDGFVFMPIQKPKGTRGFKDAANAVRKTDTHKGIYVRRRDSVEHFISDLVLFEAQDQEVIQKAWSALSESKQQDVALEVDKQFQRHLSKIGIRVDEDDVPALRNEWVKGHMLDIIQASHDFKDTSTREFPFAATLWPQKIVDACRKIWQTLSNVQKHNVVDVMNVSFQRYTADLGLTDEQDVLDLSLWESWGTQGFKNAADAVRKNDNVCFVFQPEVAIDTIQDTDKRRGAEYIVRKVQPEHEALITQEIHRRQAVLRKHLPGLDKAAIAKYELRLLETEYWNIVMQVMQGNLLPPNQIHTNEDMALEDQKVKLGKSGSTYGQNSLESSAASVQDGDSGINDAARAVNIGRLVRHNHPRSNHSPTNLAALAFVSAKEALSGDASGVRWIYECYLTSTDYTIAGGMEKQR